MQFTSIQAITNLRVTITCKSMKADYFFLKQRQDIKRNLYQTETQQQQQQQYVTQKSNTWQQKAKKRELKKTETEVERNFEMEESDRI